MSNFEYAGFWRRLMAAIVDVLILMLVIAIPLTLIYGGQYWLGEKTVHGFWDFLLSYVLPFVATILFWRRFLGTPGKMLLELCVVDAKSGQRMGLGQSVIRYFAYLISMLPLGLGFIWIVFDKKKQGWHDKLAGSIVIKHDIHDPSF